MPISLPPDLLGEIFGYYAISEDLKYPLETLLLVSRSWHEAARIHGGIWASFNIELGNYKSIDLWRTRLPRRLSLAGPTRPLDITVRNVYSISGHPFASEFLSRKDYNQPESPEQLARGVYQVRHFMLDLLQDLNGRDGSLAWRWRSLHLYFGDHPWTYSTGNNSGVTRFSWKHLQNTTKRPLVPLGKGVEKLILGFPFNGEWKIPNYLPRLWSIELGGDGPRCHLQSVQAPNLSHATLRIQSASFLPTVLSHVAFLSTITHLTILEEEAAFLSTQRRIAYRLLSAMLSLVEVRTNEPGLRGILLLVRDARNQKTNVDMITGEVELSTCPFQLRRVRVSCVDCEGDVEISSDMDSWEVALQILRSSSLATQNPHIAKMIEGLAT
ncbi:hypothetical protein PIIN_11795 [Serendipita indica DSM 11827]|uniref:F-box domain-containing protein n=1 Tax=Serendipita indica (strain DSM 11827) TaxID=1109443 RepID=G4TST2_SERID|nr:hypothetical protein PIIN_11795 [Serendipita indica DSM 11827]